MSTTADPNREALNQASKHIEQQLNSVVRLVRLETQALEDNLLTQEGSPRPNPRLLEQLTRDLERFESVLECLEEAIEHLQNKGP